MSVMQVMKMLFVCGMGFVLTHYLMTYLIAKIHIFLWMD